LLCGLSLKPASRACRPFLSPISVQAMLGRVQ
jgi:hypothetical protein